VLVASEAETRGNRPRGARGPAVRRLLPGEPADPTLADAPLPRRRIAADVRVWWRRPTCTRLALVGVGPPWFLALAEPLLRAGRLHESAARAALSDAVWLESPVRGIARSGVSRALLRARRRE
jgi:hypothetical protein